MTVSELGASLTFFYRLLDPDPWGLSLKSSRKYGQITRENERMYSKSTRIRAVYSKQFTNSLDGTLLSHIQSLTTPMKRGWKGFFLVRKTARLAVDRQVEILIYKWPHFECILSASQRRK